MAEWPCSGLQIRPPRFDSGFRLHSTLHALYEQPDARVVELVDTRDLKSLAGNSAGSSPAPGTILWLTTIPNVVLKLRFNSRVNMMRH